MHLFGYYRPPYPGTEASPGVHHAKSKADSVEQRLERALLTMEAMWTLLRERLQVTDEELANRIVEVDESDGILDGRVRRPPKACPHCKKPIPARFARCVYCGEAVAPEPFA
jgi:hypothetical protein